MLVFSCHICKTVLSADESQAGQLVRCAQCLTTLRVPAAPAGAAAAPAATRSAQAPASAPVTAPSSRSPVSQQQSVGATGGMSASSGGVVTVPAPSSRAASPPQQRVTIPSHLRAPGGGKRYGFNCAYCSSRLEATESMAGQEGQCPTCGNNIVIPILDRYGRLIDPMTGKVIKQDPHPVHAYAAAGDRAPKIVRQSNGAQMIICPRCQTMSSITSNNCKSCGMPFTMEGTTAEAAGANNGFCVASLVLGIIGVPGGCTGIAPLLAIVFGIIGLNQVSKGGGEGGGKGMAIAGICCGVVGLVIFALIVFK